ncbi:hypothetical protein [Anabaena sp. CCY 9402-a]|uniref:hypothetical protein n=1 Tax=Anabaena sp. CCY 9402-a TaxID=3103867 RepID=UPI0039C642D8
MDVNDVPLLELFTKLREAGLPLGIDEYNLVLQALQASFGMNDQAALKRLCQTVWVKSVEERQLLEYHFAAIMGNEGVLPNSEILPTPTEKYRVFSITRYLVLGFLGVGIGLSMVSDQMSQTPKLTPTPTPTSEPIQIPVPLPITPLNTTPSPTVEPTATPKQTNTNTNQTDWIWQSLLSFIALSGGYVLFKWLVQRNTQKLSSESTSHSEVNPNSAKLTQIIEDEVRVAKAVLQATSRNDEISVNRFILSSDYFPVTRRQLKQSWRYLRRPVREGARTELDVSCLL